jgi:hypothetical protein
MIHDKNGTRILVGDKLLQNDQEGTVVLVTNCLKLKLDKTKELIRINRMSEVLARAEYRPSRAMYYH